MHLSFAQDCAGFGRTRVRPFQYAFALFEASAATLYSACALGLWDMHLSFVHDCAGFGRTRVRPFQYSAFILHNLEGSCPSAACLCLWPKSTDGVASAGAVLHLIAWF
jgi:hypothetical protein